MSSVTGRPRVLISNDDGIQAPGLVALVEALKTAAFCDISVCAPSGERSASSHAITLGRYLSCYPVEMPGVDQAFAVDGTPADSVMLALCGPVFKVNSWDLVLSGINRGDNCGLHVLYSGTVGAAREAVCKGRRAMAFSVASHAPTKVEDYAAATAAAVPLIRAMLGLSSHTVNGTQQPHTAHTLEGSVININIPWCPASEVQGYYLTHQGLQCVFPCFRELAEAPGPHLPEIDAHTPDMRIFRNYSGDAQRDDTEGSDMWAVERGWVSVTPLGLRQDIVRHLADEELSSASQVRALRDVMRAAGADAQMRVRMHEKMEAEL